MKAKRNSESIVEPPSDSPAEKLTPMQELELGLDECRFGKFHIRFLVAVMMHNVANVLVSANTAYLLPNAECDLKMTMTQKGILNASPYMGMLASGFFAGFLTDTFGRKVFLVYGNIGLFLCCIGGGSSQNYETLLVMKFIEGFVFSAAFNAMIASTSEITNKKIRDRVMLCSSSFIALAHCIVALFSWGILPHKFKIFLLSGSFYLSSWNIYLYACGIFSFTACVMYCFLPESPKWLVAHERYRETLHVLRKIYAENTGKPMDTFSLKSIGGSTILSFSSSSVSLSKETITKRIVQSLLDIKPLFRRPLICHLTLICTMQIMTMLVYNDLRLWYPQLSTIMENFAERHGKTADLCLMLDSYMLEQEKIQNNTTSVAQNNADCIQKRSGAETYINSLIMGGACIVPYIFTATLVTRVGKKALLLVSLTIACASVTCLGWAKSAAQVLTLVSITVSLTQTSVSIYQTIVAETFPTVTKSLAISLMMMAGRIGTLTGNILFPILLAQGCLIPFISLSGILICVLLLSFLLPASPNK